MASSWLSPAEKQEKAVLTVMNPAKDEPTASLSYEGEQDCKMISCSWKDNLNRSSFAQTKKLSGVICRTCSGRRMWICPNLTSSV